MANITIKSNGDHDIDVSSSPRPIITIGKFVTGRQGEPGKDGQDGYTPVKGVDYFDGEKGDPGAPGQKGDKGDPGTTDYNQLENKPDLSVYAIKDEVDMALLDKLDASHVPDSIYATGEMGAQTQIEYASQAKNFTIPYRDGNGFFSVKTPTSSAHAANRQYVDDRTADKVSKSGDTMTGTLNVPSLVVKSGAGGLVPISIEYKSDNDFSSGLAVNKRGNATSENGNTRNGSEIGYHVFNGFDGIINKRLAYVAVRALGDTSSSTGGGIYSIHTRSAGGVEGSRVEITDSNTVFNQRLTVEGVAITSGTTVPEGSITAPVGSIYIHRTAANGNLRYIKKSGTGTTGWVLDRADNKIEGVGTSKITVSVQEPTNIGIGDIWIPL